MGREEDCQSGRCGSVGVQCRHAAPLLLASDGFLPALCLASLPLFFVNLWIKMVHYYLLA